MRVRHQPAGTRTRKWISRDSDTGRNFQEVHEERLKNASPSGSMSFPGKIISHLEKNLLGCAWAFPEKHLTSLSITTTMTRLQNHLTGAFTQQLCCVFIYLGRCCLTRLLKEKRREVRDANAHPSDVVAQATLKTLFKYRELYLSCYLDENPTYTCASAKFRTVRWIQKENFFENYVRMTGIVGRSAIPDLVIVLLIIRHTMKENTEKHH